jgi:hypothetical protein
MAAAAMVPDRGKPVGDQACIVDAERITSVSRPAAIRKHPASFALGNNALSQV